MKTVLKIDSAQHKITSHNVDVWTAASFAEAWYRDAVAEAESLCDGDARRREIVFAVCAVESYLFEWTRDEVLNRDYERLPKYFKPGDKRPIQKKWKEVLKLLVQDREIPALPSCNDQSWHEFMDLVKYRNGLVHAQASRPERGGQSEKERPVPVVGELKKIEAGWACRVVSNLLVNLHEVTATASPKWLTNVD